MEFANLLSIIIAVGYVCLIIYTANQAQIGVRTPMLKPPLYGLIAAVTITGLLLLLPNEGQEVDTSAAAFVILILCFAAFVLTADANARRHLRAILPTSAAYNPDAPVHITAVALILVFTAQTLAQFAQLGGISGLAESLESAGGVGISDALFTQFVWLLGAALGIGLFMRRSPGAALTRLGLRAPQPADINWGVGVGLGMYGVVIIVSLVWAALVPPDQLADQTAAAQQIGASINSIPLALAISGLVAFGEEIFFRGALQPIFGNVVTSIFFAVLHTQYALTPATLAIIALSLALGWLRNRHSTTAAIIAHFVYNFVQLALAIWASSVLT